MPKYQQLEPPHLDETQAGPQIETLENDNLDKTQPDEDQKTKTIDNDNLEKIQPEEELSLDQVEPKDDDYEIPQMDQIQPFILEGL